jgi:hypothetical protein
MSLDKYLEAEDRAFKDSPSRFPHHYRLFCELAHLYDAAGGKAVLLTDEMVIPVKLFLVVHSQMYGVASQLLRRRITDAEGLTRRALEATAAAHYLWKHPDLCDTFEEAYPNAANIDAPDQWKRSKAYREQFQTSDLFGEPTPPWPHLNSLYAFFSAMSSHAGPGATVPHEIRSGRLELHFIEPDNRTVRLAWEYLLNAYQELLEVFLTILSASVEAATLDAIKAASGQWKQRAATLLREKKSTDQHGGSEKEA